MIYYFEMDDPDIKEIYVDVPQKYMARLIPKSCEGNIFDYSDGCKKKRVKDYVLYNVEWLKENYQQELDLLGVKNQGKWKRISPQDIYECSECGQASNDTCGTLRR